MRPGRTGRVRRSPSARVPFPLPKAPLMQMITARRTSLVPCSVQQRGRWPCHGRAERRRCRARGLPSLPARAAPPHGRFTGGPHAAGPQRRASRPRAPPPARTRALPVPVLHGTPAKRSPTALHISWTDHVSAGCPDLAVTAPPRPENRSSSSHSTVHHHALSGVSLALSDGRHGQRQLDPVRRVGEPPPGEPLKPSRRIRFSAVLRWQYRRSASRRRRSALGQPRLERPEQRLALGMRQPQHPAQYHGRQSAGQLPAGPRAARQAAVRPVAPSRRTRRRHTCAAPARPATGPARAQPANPPSDTHPHPGLLLRERPDGLRERTASQVDERELAIRPYPPEQPRAVVVGGPAVGRSAGVRRVGSRRRCRRRAGPEPPTGRWRRPAGPAAGPGRAR